MGAFKTIEMKSLEIQGLEILRIYDGVEGIQMKKGIIYKCMIGLGICLALGGGIYYYKAPQAERLDLKTMIRDLNSERQAEIEEPIQYKLADFQKELEPNDFTDEELDQLFTKGYRRLVTKEEAIEDIKVLFRALRQSYSGYIYFGGKKQFDQAEQEMITRVESLTEERITTGGFEQILREGLAFIVDSHFWINGKSLGFNEQYCYYGSGIDQIEKDSKGYYILEQGKKSYIEEQFEPYIKPTIGEEGQIVYGLFAVVDQEEKEKLPITILLNRRRKTSQKEIEWKLCKVGTFTLEAGCSNYSYKEISQIPVVTYRNMQAGNETNAFIADGIKLRDREVAVLDLRGNVGGDFLINFSWLYQITGEGIYPKQILIDYKSQIQSYVAELATKSLATSESMENVEFKGDVSNLEELRAQKKEYEKYIDEQEKWNITHHDQGEQWNENKTLWFVLVNKNVYSAGEMFLRQMETMSNVIIVGTNSNGCLVTGCPLRNTPLYLPNSKNQIVYGTSLNVANDMEGYDARGTLPDIYIANEDALDAVVRCYEHYKEELISQD